MANQYLKPVTTIPSSLLILDITRSFPMVLTVFVQTPFPVANTYFVDMAVKLYVPITYKMFQANGLIGKILAINGDVFALDIDSTNFDAYVIPMTSVEAPASISPYGSQNLQYNNNNINTVPFQSLNNQGN